MKGVEKVTWRKRGRERRGGGGKGKNKRGGKVRTRKGSRWLVE